MYFANAYDRNGILIEKIPVTFQKDGMKAVASIEKCFIPPATYKLDFMPNFANARAGETGYMIVPHGNPNAQASYMLCSFREQPNYERATLDSALPIYGIKKADFCFVAIVTGMRCDLGFVAGVIDGLHYVYPRFYLDGDGAYEDVRIEYHFLTGYDADYSGMARKYREYQLSVGGCKPLKERVKDNPYLKYAVESINIRIRLGMKPIPPTVLEQTLENEPEMVVCCTLDRFKSLIDEFKKQGIKKAEFCLIGWNIRGHDGRYPDMFPVEEKIGGEQKLREVIRYGQAQGYQMTGHTNSTDAYTIASCWKDENILMKKDGSLSVDEYPWSGGRMYQLCPSIAYEQAQETLPKVADLGFKGVHYIDVISTVAPRKCYRELHPVNRKQSVAYNERIMRLTKNLFGGMSSEGAYDYNIKDLDFALSVHTEFGKKPQICDREIPLFELVYHGITLYGVSWSVIGANAKDEDSQALMRYRLKNLEFGGRDVAYFHHFFHGRKEEIALGYSTADSEMEDSVRRLKVKYDDYQKFSYLQYEFMEKHEEIAENVFKTTYSNGTSIIVNYNDNTYQIEN